MTEPSAWGSQGLPESVAKLATLTFSASDLITAAGVTADQLDLYQRKAGLLLCSDPPGRGRSRQFPLADIYLIALMGRLTRLCGSQAWAAGSLEYLIYPPVPQRQASRPIERGPYLDRRRAELAADISAAHPLFWVRSWHGVPWILFAEDGNIAKDILGLEAANVSDLDALVGSHEGYFLNVTKLLDSVDKRLLAIVGAA